MHNVGAAALTQEKQSIGRYQESKDEILQQMSCLWPTEDLKEEMCQQVY